MSDGTDSVCDSFEREFAAYVAKRDEYLRLGLEGQYAVFKGDTEICTVPTYEDAVYQGIVRTKSREFFVQRIQSADTVEWLSHIA